MCATPRCGTLLPADAEICDECGGGALVPLGEEAVLLVAAAGDRHVAFPLNRLREQSIGRAVEGSTSPDVDLGVLPGGDSVHRLHATLVCSDSGWMITHRGQNPVVIQRGDEALSVAPGDTTELLPGDGLVVGRVRLQFLVGA